MTEEDAPVGVRIKQSIVAARAQLDDLQSELEAGARFARKLEGYVAVLNNGRTVGNHLKEAQGLLDRLAELRASVRAQRWLMRQLRGSLDDLRRASHRLKPR
jgi:hypothetical protein